MPASTTDPYATLGLARGASEKEIKAAYRRLAKTLHPDRNAGNPKAAERFAELTNAYDLLSDKDKRARFDRGEIDAAGNPTMPEGFARGFGGQGFGNQSFGGAGFGEGFGPQGFAGHAPGMEGLDLGDILEGLFAGGAGPSAMHPGAGGFGGRRPARKGANVTYRLAVSLPDAATCAVQRLTLANGNTIDVKLPAGLVEGTQMRLAGKGEAGPGGPGDAIVTLTIQPHPFFTRDGDNIRLELPISLDEAVFGAKLRVPTVDGPVMLAVAPLPSPGQTLRLKGRGFTRKDGSRGDQLVAPRVVLPEAGSREAAELARRLEGWRDLRDPRARLMD